MRRVWPRPSVWFVFGCLTLIAVSVGTLFSLSWGPTQWREFTAGTREASLLAAIVTATFCAHIPRSLTSAGIVAGRPAIAAYRVVNWHLSRVAVTVGFATLLAELVVGLYVAAQSDGGRPDLLSAAGVIAGNIAVGFVAYSLSLCIAVKAGGLIATIGTVVGVALLALLNPAFGAFGISTLQPALIWLNNFPMIGWEITTQTALVRLVLFIFLGVACWLIALVRVKRPLGPKFPATSFVLVVAIMASIAIIQSPALVHRKVIDAACDDEGNTEVCVHPDYLSLSDQVNHLVGETLAPVPERQRPRLVQQTGTRMIPGVDAVAIQLDHLSSRQDFVSAIAIPLSNKVSGQEECWRRSKEIPAGEPAPESITKARNMQLALALTLQERVGVRIYTGLADESTGQPVRPPELEAFSALGDNELKAWIGAHAEEIENCSMTLDSVQ